MITERDVEIVRVLDESGGMDVKSLMRVFGAAQAAIYRRLLRMEDYKMVRAERPFLRLPALYVPTARGMRELVGRDDLLPPSVSPGSYNHQVQVGRVLAEVQALGVRWEASRLTRRNQSEAREAGDAAAARRFAIELSWLQRHHLPDAIVWPPGENMDGRPPLAVEVELSVKSKARLDEILSGYAASPDLAGVAYLCGERGVLNAVSRAKSRAEGSGLRTDYLTIVPPGPSSGHAKSLAQLVASGRSDAR